MRQAGWAFVRALSWSWYASFPFCRKPGTPAAAALPLDEQRQASLTFLFPRLNRRDPALGRLLRQRFYINQELRAGERRRVTEWAFLERGGFWPGPCSPLDQRGLPWAQP